MLVRFGFEIVLRCPEPVTMLLALSPHHEFDGRLLRPDAIHTEPPVDLEEYRDSFDNRIHRMVAPPGPMTIWSDNIAEIDGRPDIVVPDAPQLQVNDLPTDTLQFLVASRYVDSDELSDFAWSQFGKITGGWERVQAICDFVHERTTFGYEFGRSTKTAGETFEEKAGVCRDFAHLGVALCRAMNIPARYASGYLGDIGVPPAGPGDFCAWFEVFLGERWYTFDPRYNMPRIGRVLMVRGRDAADVAMMTAFGNYDLHGFRVWTDEVTDEAAKHSVEELLSTLPDAAALVEPSSARLAS